MKLPKRQTNHEDRTNKVIPGVIYFISLLLAAVVLIRAAISFFSFDELD